ncbi:MAG: HAMP domain-containing histidine kinase [Flavobacteriia bacterium]|nr:HAMP domain-containing histidine kinase [Flavobacteriia bacterium]
MKIRLLLLLVCASIWGHGQTLRDTLNGYLDTCETPNGVRNVARSYARANVVYGMDKAHLMLRMARERIFNEDDSIAKGDIIHEHAILHAIRQEADSAIILIKEAIKYYPENDSVKRGYAYRNLCAMHRIAENFNESLNNGYIALRYLPHDDSLFRPLTYLEVGKVLYTLQNYELSLEYAEKALPYFEATNDLFNISSSYNSIGLAYLNIDTAVEQSIVPLKAAKSIHLQLGDSLSLYETHINLGIAYIMNKEFDSALVHFNIVEQSDFLNTTQRLNIKPILYANKGLTLHRLGNSDEGLEYSLEGLKLAQESGSDYIIERAAQTIAEIYLLRGDTVSAFKYQDIYHKAFEINSKISNESRYLTLEKLVDEQLRLQRAEFKARQLQEEAKHDAEHLRYLYLGLGVLLVVLALLFTMYRQTSKRKAMLAKANSQLSSMDESKTRLFSIIGHDLRGPIGNSAYLLSEIQNSEKGMSTESKEILENVEHGLIQVQELLENLLMWAKEEASEAELNRTRVNISELVQDCNKMLSPLSQINDMKLDVDIKPNLHWELDKNAYSTILRNTLSNSLKYASKSSTVEVSAKVVDHQLVTKICDYGDGIPKEMVEQLKSSDKFTNTTSNGMGLHLVSLLTKKHGGSLSYSYDGNKGCLTIVIPE